MSDDVLVIGVGLGLFQVDEGVVHWVIAKDEEDAKAVVLADHYGNTTPRDWTVEPPTVKRLTIAMAEKATFADPDADTLPSMRAEAEKNPVRRYVACSEY